MLKNGLDRVMETFLEDSVPPAALQKHSPTFQYTAEHLGKNDALTPAMYIVRLFSELIDAGVMFDSTSLKATEVLLDFLRIANKLDLDTFKSVSQLSDDALYLRAIRRDIFAQVLWCERYKQNNKPMQKLLDLAYSPTHAIAAQRLVAEGYVEGQYGLPQDPEMHKIFSDKLKKLSGEPTKLMEKDSQQGLPTAAVYQDSRVYLNKGWLLVLENLVQGRLTINVIAFHALRRSYQSRAKLYQ
jgi:hypothetical protein